MPHAGRLLDILTELRAQVADHTHWTEAYLAQVHDDHRASARNLLHYLGLRRRDLRQVQRDLTVLGLSSLGRCEPHVLATLDAVIAALHKLAGRDSVETTPEAPVDFVSGPGRLALNRDAVLGREPEGRGVRIMVTMPSEAARDYEMVRDLLLSGMDCMRINCAHDDERAWLRMIEHLRRAERETNRSCRVAMDLAGPKLRTGPITPGPPVIRLKPERDDCGLVVAVARVWLTPAERPTPPPAPADACLPVDHGWLNLLAVGEQIHFTDARGSERTLWVTQPRAHGCWAEASKTSYIVTGTELHRAHGSHGSRTTAVGQIPPLEGVLVLREGDPLVITRNQEPGAPATLDSAGRVLTPASIGCTIPEVFEDVHVGEPIWFDDGAIGGVIEEITPDCVAVRITRAKPQGAKLRRDKGINLPESNLRLPALTSKDFADLPFVATHADLVELSFANHPADVELLQAKLAALGDRAPAIVLKIETRQGFEHLPELLLVAMRSPRCAVMIARGDLAVECGFERLAEVQEEILWVCEAAHVPVIWATQVLESLAKDGRPSRAEISDAAMAHRAECVMLNKGPHVVMAVRALDNILRRMQAHQVKKTAMLRELRLAQLDR